MNNTVDEGEEPSRNMVDTRARSSNDLLQLLVQEFARMQVTERQQMQDFLGQQEQSVQETLQQQELRVQEKIEENNAIVRALEERVLRMEERMVMLEGQLPSGSEREVIASAGGQEQLEPRMKKLEASIQKALESVFPRVESLLAQLEKHRPPVGPPAPTSTPKDNSALVSSSSPPPESTASPPSEPLTLSPSSTMSAPDLSSSPPPDARASPPLDTSPSTFSSMLHDALGRNLLTAAKDGILGEVRRLLDAGANPNFSSGDGWTPLLTAARHNRISVVALLLQRGADLHARNYVGNTALHNAVYQDSTGECVSLLIDAGAHVNSRGEYGSPLHCAVLNNNVGAVRVLLAAGASTTAVDSYGRTPLQVAWSDEVQQLLNS